MQKIKNLAYLLSFSLLLFSCGEYQKVLNKGTSEEEAAKVVSQAQELAKSLIKQREAHVKRNDEDKHI